MTPDQLTDRLNRGFGSRFKQEFGDRTPEQVQADLARLGEMEAAEAERKKAEMTEIERLRTEKEEAEAAAEAAQEARDAAQFEQQIAATCAELGVKNVQYAMWQVAGKTESLAEGEQLNVKEFLTEELKTQGAAYGYQPPPAPPQQVSSPVTTDPSGQQPPGAVPPPPPAPGAVQDPQGGDAFALDDAAWAAKKQSLGIT